LRLLLYNIRYATGAAAGFHFPLPGAGYLRNTSRNLVHITDFIRAQSPDIVGLVEVDLGSMRSSAVNQAEAIGRATGLFPCYQSKYGHRSINQRLPIVRKQGNAFLTRNPDAVRRFHYFELGIKRLIMEVELEQISLFLVHLSLKYRHRHHQMHHLLSLVKNATKPVIVAGDFNTLMGDYEIGMFSAAAGLSNANVRGLPTWPSRRPRRQLDFILHGPGIEMTNFELPQVDHSDHLPLICDFEIQGVR
jgi:endonuclease/exonuclease/phosphatase family metal-dependent hydrolase